MRIGDSKRLHISLKNVHSQDLERVLGVLLCTFNIASIQIQRHTRHRGDGATWSSLVHRYLSVPSSPPICPGGGSVG